MTRRPRVSWASRCCGATFRSTSSGSRSWAPSMRTWPRRSTTPSACQFACSRFCRWFWSSRGWRSPCGWPGRDSGRRAATFTAALLVLPPDFLLSWTVEARTHYQLSVVLGTLALLLALRVAASPRRSGFVGFGVLGGVLGLAFWTNFLSLVFLPSVGILLLRAGLRRLAVGLAIAAVTFTLGSLPHWLYGVQHGTALPPPGRSGRASPGVPQPRRRGARVVAHHRRSARSLRERWPGMLLAAALAVAYALAITLAARANPARRCAGSRGWARAGGARRGQRGRRSGDPVRAASRRSGPEVSAARLHGPARTLGRRAGRASVGGWRGAGWGSARRPGDRRRDGTLHGLAPRRSRRWTRSGEPRSRPSR